MVSIEIRGVTKRFGSKVAIHNADLEIHDKEIFSIIGPSGSGKTSLLRIIAGLETPTSGRVYFNGKDVTDLKPNERNIGMVFQDYALWPHLDVYHNISLVLKGKEEKEKVSSILNRVGLSHKMKSRISDLSGGEMQRVALARALVMNPDILLMDEPLSNLDTKIKRDLIVETLRVIRDIGITTVFVTHAQEEAYEMADRLAVMNQALIEQIGRPEEVYTNPASLFVADFMSESIVLQMSVESRKDGMVRMTGEAGPLEIPEEFVPVGFAQGRIVIRIDELEVTNAISDPCLPASVMDYRFNTGVYDMLLTLPESRIIRKRVPRKIGNVGDKVFLRLVPGSFFIFPDDVTVPEPTPP
jgi:ABC-type Fe3+/spermidine/putrescine transport system ATPase subunit